ncbi:ABC transporter substrate-binding protein [Nocardia higoensis]|uniref:ABC transporter substrate-binding protein n=1 Tax=Nocardia higoensis TaxID=228599 RepID=UPI000595457F|nr:ABC transporter substrate-binding protein [Nocardia higoensis]
MARKRRVERWAAVSVLAALTLSACSSNDGSSSIGPTGDPVSGGTLKVGTGLDPICVDPNQTDLTATRDILRQVGDSLVDADPETGEIVPWLATEWVVNDNATVFDFGLRSGVTFSNGEVFDAAAAKAFLDGVDALGGRAFNASSYLEGYLGTEVVAPDKIRVSFDQPNASFLQALSTVNMAVLSPSTYQLPPEQRCLGQISATGAFVLDHYTPTQEVVLTKRAGYAWPSANAEHEGEAYLDRIEYRVIPEAGVRVGSLRSGEVDLINQVPQQDEDVLKTTGFGVLTTNNPGTVFEYLTNNSSPILSDESVRKAIQFGIDREEYRATVLLPRYNIATSVLSSTTPHYTDFSQYIKYDPEESKRLLDGAGWLPGADGIRAKDGKRLSLTVLNGHGIGTDTYELVAQQLQRIGVELIIRTVSRAEMLAALDTGQYDFVPYGFTRADPAALTMHFTTKRNNPLRLQPSELDTYLEQQAAASRPEDRQVAVDNAARYITEHALVILLSEQSVAHGYSGSLGGLRWEPGAQLSLYDAWLQR